MNFLQERVVNFLQERVVIFLYERVVFFLKMSAGWISFRNALWIFFKERATIIFLGRATIIFVGRPAKFFLGRVSLKKNLNAIINELQRRNSTANTTTKDQSLLSFFNFPFVTIKICSELLRVFFANILTSPTNGPVHSDSVSNDS